MRGLSYNPLTQTYSLRADTDVNYLMACRARWRLSVRPKAVLFDLDGTLVDSAPDLAAAANDALGSWHGAAGCPLALPAMVGSGARHGVSLLTCRPVTLATTRAGTSS